MGAFSDKTVAVGGTRLRYCEAGSGRALLCLSDDGASRISRAHEILAETHRVIALELPGATVADAAGLVRGAAAALAIERYDLMGHGRGAGLALAAALACRNVVDAVVLLAPVATLEAALGELQVPVLALFGTADPVTPTSAARLYRAILPNCNVVMVYDAAHAMDAERPEAVAAVVADFLERRESFIVSRESGLIHP
jgi:pimeloyl-ACP methyl ester carboxylesterase